MDNDALIQDSEYDNFPTEQLLEFLTRGGMLPRTRAIAALGRRAGNDTFLIEKLVTAITSQRNRETRIMGTISVAHIGFICLWRFGTQQARTQLQSLLASWPEPDRSDLLWFLKSEGISEIE